MMMFPKSKFDEFSIYYKSKECNHLRIGQAFYVFMGLEKVVSEKEFCDKIYYADNEIAVDLIVSRIDERF